MTLVKLVRRKCEHLNLWLEMNCSLEKKYLFSVCKTLGSCQLTLQAQEISLCSSAEGICINLGEILSTESVPFCHMCNTSRGRKHMLHAVWLEPQYWQTGTQSSEFSIARWDKDRHFKMPCWFCVAADSKRWKFNISFWEVNGWWAYLERCRGEAGMFA